MIFSIYGNSFMLLIFPESMLNTMTMTVTNYMEFVTIVSFNGSFYILPIFILRIGGQSGLTNIAKSAIFSTATTRLETW